MSSPSFKNFMFALESIQKLPLQDSPLVNPIARKHFVQRKIDSTDAKAIVFSIEGWHSVCKLTEDLRKEEPKYKSKTDLLVFTDTVADKLIDIWKQYANNLNKASLDELRSVLETWFSSYSGTRYHFIPCNIILRPAQSFNIGDIRFFHLNEFNPYDFSIHKKIDYDDFFKYFNSQIKERDANWIAVVPVKDCEKKRSAEKANLAVDLSLAGLQLLIPELFSKYIARITGQIFPSYLSTVSVNNGEVSSDNKRIDPCLALRTCVFEERISSNSKSLAE